MTDEERKRVKDIESFKATGDAYLMWESADWLIAVVRKQDAEIERLTCPACRGGVCSAHQPKWSPIVSTGTSSPERSFYSAEDEF